MDDPKRQLLTLALMIVAIGGFYAYAELTAPAPGTESAAEPAGDGAPGSDEERPTPVVIAGVAGTPLAEAAPTTEVAERRRDQERLFTIETPEMRAQLSNLNTGLVHVELKEERFRSEDGHRIDIVTTDKERFYAQRLVVEGVAVPADAVWEGEQLSETAVRFTWRGDQMRIVRRVEAGRGPYQLWSTVEVRNEDAGERFARVRYFTYHYVDKENEASGGFIGRPSPLVSSGVCRHGDTTEREGTEELLDARGFGPDVRFAGAHNTYFANLVVAPEGAERCVVVAHRRGPPADYLGTLVQAELRLEGQQLPAGGTLTSRAMGYVGPTDRDALRLAGNDLAEVIDLGWLSFIANGLIDLLRWIYGRVGDWGLAIILLTLLVKLVFYPLNVRSFRAMARMRILKPELDLINEKFGDNRELKGQATMELWRKHKVNPAAGCLPSLLQMPVWLALYRSLSTNLELYHAPFLVWSDLSGPDPYFVLPGLVALLMHVQQRLTPTTMDPAQAKMLLYLMPVMIGAFMLFLPAGLCLYMVTNSILTIVQQKVIYAQLDRESGKRADAASVDEGDDDEGAADAIGEPIPAGATAGESSARRRSVRPRNRKKRPRRG